MYAHDHTVKKFPITNYKSIHYVKLGIGASNNDALNLRTLNTLLMHNGHSQRTINYLKVTQYLHTRLANDHDRDQIF